MGKSFAVLGLGKFGAGLAADLATAGAEVLAVDIKEEKVKAISDQVTYAVRADVCEADALRALGLDHMDAVIIAMSSNLDASILSTLTAKELGAGHVIVKCQDKLHEKILLKIGADKVVIPEQESALRLSKNLISGNFLDFIELADDIGLAELQIRPEWIGKTLQGLDFRKKYGATVCAIKNADGMRAEVDPYSPLRADDTLFVLADTKRIKKLI